MDHVKDNNCDVHHILIFIKGTIIMNTPITESINTSFSTPASNTKTNPIINNAIELATVFTVWAVVSTCILFLSFTWV